MTTVGFRGRRRPSRSGFVVPISALRALRDAGLLASSEFRERAGRVEFRTHPGADWRPVEEAAHPPGPVQLPALPSAPKENR